MPKKFVDTDSHAKNVTTIINKHSKIPFCHLRFNKPVVNEICDAELVTEQYHAENLDLNNIVATYQRAGIPIKPEFVKSKYDGIIPNGNADFVADLHQQMTVVQDNFNALPAKLKLQFDNDYTKFSDYLSKVSDDELEKLVKQHGFSFEKPNTSGSVQSGATVDTGIVTPQPVEPPQEVM